MSKRSTGQQERDEDAHQAWSANGLVHRVRDELISNVRGDMSKHDEEERAERRHKSGMTRKDRGKVLLAFLIHLGVYVAVVTFLFLLNFITGTDSWWFIFPALGMGLALGIHAVVTLVILNLAKVEHWADQPMLRQPAPKRKHVQADQQSSEIENLMQQGTAKIDGIRDTARRIPNSNARQEALDVCASADRVLSAIAEHPEELPLARKFLYNIVEPTEKIVSNYQRLSSRDIASAQESLAQVQQHDLPLIRQKMDEVYERLHRGAVIDLDVAREMLVLDIPAAAPERSKE